MDRDRDFDLEAPLPGHTEDLIGDLGLEPLLEVMAGGDDFLHRVTRVALLSSLEDPRRIEYRQRVLLDCLHRPDLARSLYDLAGEALASERKVWGSFLSNSPSGLLYRSVELLELLVEALRTLRGVAERERNEVRSKALVALFDLSLAELDDEYLARVEDHLERLRFQRGLQFSAQLGQGLRQVEHTVRRPSRRGSRWTALLRRHDRDGYSFTIPDRDEAGWQALAELRNQALSSLAQVVAEATDHLLAFFTMLRREIGFYVGCVRLHARLTRDGLPVCIPTPRAPGSAGLRCTGLYEPVLGLRARGQIVGNDVEAEGIRLVMVTGANQGGKSTFLRSVGIAALMMQCGMFVPARSFVATVYRGVFTHYRRAEDTTMTSGKLDEELGRMSAIVDVIRPGSLLLSNESFASTNEQEGSRIARHVFRTMAECGVTVVAVTHLFDLASGLYQRGGSVLFLRAEREPDGRRTFRLVEGEPLPTSFGRDIYERVFGATDRT